MTTYLLVKITSLAQSYTTTLLLGHGFIREQSASYFQISLNFSGLRVILKRFYEPSTRETSQY